MPDTYPIQLKLAGRKCVVVGGGFIAARKVDRLRQADADVHVVSPSFCEALAARSDVVRHPVDFEAALLAGAVMVFACTDRADLNRQIAAEARQAGAWCNVADDPEACDFFVPAGLQRGRLQINVSTDGASPLLAAAVRDRLGSEIGPEYGILSEELALARELVQQRVDDPDLRREIFRTLCADCSIELLRKSDRQAWREWFERLLAARLNEGGNRGNEDDG